MHVSNCCKPICGNNRSGFLNRIGSEQIKFKLLRLEQNRFTSWFINKTIQGRIRAVLYSENNILSPKLVSKLVSKWIYPKQYQKSWSDQNQAAFVEVSFDFGSDPVWFQITHVQMCRSFYIYTYMLRS